MRIDALVLACIAGFAVSACSEPEVTPTEVPEVSVPGDVPPQMPPAIVDVDEDEGLMDEGAGSGDDVRRFDCESGHRVELVGNDIARVTLADGRVIELPRRADGVAEYRGVALSFDLNDIGDAGVLGQDEVGGFDCTSAT